jgi:hypothetical protein
MPTPKEAADALILLTAQADTIIEALRPVLADIDAAEKALRSALQSAGQPLLDHLAYRARVSHTARQMLENDLGQTLTSLTQTAFARELAQ